MRQRSRSRPWSRPRPRALPPGSSTRSLPGHPKSTRPSTRKLPGRPSRRPSGRPRSISIPFEPAEVEHAEVSELDAQHDASVGRIGDLLARIEEGASTFNALRAQIGGLTESLRSAEETVSVRERRLEELTGAHEAGERRIEELLGQLHEREEELISVGGKLDDLSGRLVSAEQRLDDREQRLEELFRQVERRDNALSDFETKLNGIAARFAEHVA